MSGRPRRFAAAAPDNSAGSRARQQPICQRVSVLGARYWFARGVIVKHPEPLRQGSDRESADTRRQWSLRQSERTEAHRVSCGRMWRNSARAAASTRACATCIRVVVLPEPRKPPMQSSFTARPRREQLRAEVGEGELVAWRDNNEIVAPVARDKRVDDASRAPHGLYGEVEARRKVGDLGAGGTQVMATHIDDHDASVALKKQTHHLVSTFETTLLDQRLVVAEYRVALVQVGLCQVV